MKRLKDVLRDIERNHNKLGGAMSVKVREELDAHRRRQFRIFITIEVIVVVAIVGCVSLLVFDHLAESLVKNVAGMVGIGAGGGGFEIARRVWRDWSQTDLLLLLINGASDAQVRTLVDKLIERL